MVSIPAGDGLLCAVGTSLRSQVQFTSGGMTTFTHFNGFAFGSVPFSSSTMNLQFWYRDPDNICSNAGFNFTNAWTVTYLP